MIKNSKSSQQFIGYNNGERPKGDFYATPPIAVEKLIQHFFIGKSVLEPCCGNGAISEVLKKHDFSVDSFDLNDWGYGTTGVDFLTESFYNYDSVVTNPPFLLSTEFALKALKVTRANEGTVCMLNRLAWLEGVKRKELFENTPLEKVLVFSKRLPRMHRFDFTGTPSSSMLAFAWFCWNHKYKGKPTIEWI